MDDDGFCILRRHFPIFSGALVTEPVSDWRLTAGQRSMPGLEAHAALPDSDQPDAQTMASKMFTVAEANALIPTLEAVLAEIGSRMKKVHRTAERLQVLDVLWGQKILAKDNPDYSEAQSFRMQIATLLGEIEDIVEREIQARGLRFPQGGLEYGLIDFPTTWQGRWVYLCWRKSEPIIASWHELDEGFSGRQDLTLEQVRGMGRGAEQEGMPDLPWR